MTQSRAGVGFSENPDSFSAGKEAAQAALGKMGEGEAQLVWIYQTGKHSPERFSEGVISVVGKRATLVGGYAAGTMADGKLGYDGFQTAVATLQFGETKFEAYLERDLRGRGEKAVGAALGEQVRREHPGADEFGLIYMYDTIKNYSAGGGFELNVGTHLLEGMGRGLGKWPEAAGFGMIGNMQCNPTRQFFDGETLEQAAIALAFHGRGFKLRTLVMHGCRPASDYHKITKAAGNVIFEIDGKPALEKIDEIMGPGSHLTWDQYPLFLTLGVNNGERFADFQEENYASRLCMAIDKQNKSLIMFEPDLVEGTEIQVMRREVDLEAMEQRTTEFFASFGKSQPFFALYIDCAGRAAAYSGSSEEEGAVVQKVVERYCPMLGMYTGVELCAVGNVRQRALDWTGVLCVWTEK